MKILTKFLLQKGGLPSPPPPQATYLLFWDIFCILGGHFVRIFTMMSPSLSYRNSILSTLFLIAVSLASVSILFLISPCALFPSVSLFLFKSYSITFLVFFFFATWNVILLFFALCVPYLSYFDSVVTTSLTMVVLLQNLSLHRLSMPFNITIMIITSLFRVSL